MRKIFRRGMLGLFFVAIFGGAVGDALAEYPDHQIRLIVPYAPGGGTDLTARLLASRMTQLLGQAVIVENRPGAGAQLGTRYVADAPADGYTLLMGSNGMCIDVTLFKNLPYDATKDLVPVAPAGISPNLLLANPSLPVNSVAELVQYAKDHPDQLNFGSAGIGQTPHLAGELLNLMAGIHLKHIPFKGSGESTLNLLSGTVQLSFATMPSTLNYVKLGKLKALAIASPERSRFLPNVPTMIESGYPGFIAATWTGIFAPAKTPKPIVEKLNQTIVQILKEPDVIDLLGKDGLEAQPMTSEQFTDYFNSEVERWAKVIKAANIHVD